MFVPSRPRLLRRYLHASVPPKPHPIIPPAQENVKRHGFTFPEVNVLLLVDWVNAVTEENIILDLEVSDFAALAEHGARRRATR